MDTFEMIAAERRDTADLLAGLDPAQWASASLCEGWTIRELAAHLTMPFEVSLLRVVGGMIAARGNFNKVADKWAHRLARRPTNELVSTLRANAEHRFTPPGGGPEFPLTDIVIHGLDLRVPLGLPTTRPVDRVTRVLDFLVSKNATKGFVKKGLVDGLALRATDADWSRGTGLEVAGTGVDLALAISGRRLALERLSGSGVHQLTTRLG